MPAHLSVGEGDSALDERLSSELDAYNFAAVGRDDLREFTVRVDDGDELVAGASGWTWAPAQGSGCSGSLQPYAARAGAAGCSPPPLRRRMVREAAAGMGEGM